VKRIAYLDAVRALAVILIVFVHAWAPLVANADFIAAEHGWIHSAHGWIIWETISFPTRCGVPLFAMLTGALMLGRDYPNISAFLKKKLLKFGAATLVCAVLYWIFVHFLFGIPFKGFSKGLFRGDPLGAYHLWYMYMLIGLYASVPLLARLLKILPEREFLYIIILSFVLVIIPFTLKRESLGLAYFGSYSFLIQAWPLYALLGYWLHKYNGLKNSDIRLRLAAFFLLWTAIVWVEFYKLFYKNPLGDLDKITAYDSLWVFAASVLLFSIIRDCFANAERLNGAVRLIAESAFSIYLWHLIAIHLGIYLYPHLGGNVFIAPFVMLLSGITIGIVIYLALRNTKLSWLVK